MPARLRRNCASLMARIALAIVMLSVLGAVHPLFGQTVVCNNYNTTNDSSITETCSYYDYSSGAYVSAQGQAWQYYACNLLSATANASYSSVGRFRKFHRELLRHRQLEYCFLRELFVY